MTATCWVVVWQWSAPVVRYLAETGFRFDYRAYGISVYRAAGRSG